MIPVCNLRTGIRAYAFRVAHELCRQRMAEVLSDLESFMESEDLEVSDIRASNSYGWFRHYSESYPEPNVTVFHYRNIENERMHVDVFEYHVSAGVVYFEKRVDDAAVTEAERVWDAG